jgi:O-antigen ligase
LIWTGFLLIPLSVLMIKYYPDLARYYDRWNWSTCFSGVTTNKNALGVICLLFGLASAWQFLAALFGEHTTGWLRRLIAHGAILGMVAWLFSLANSMTSLACFAIGISMLLALALRRRPRGDRSVQVTLVNRMIVHALVVVLIAVPSVVLFAGIASILEMMGRSPTLTDRTLVWDLLLAQTENPLFGTGFENFWLGPRLERLWSVYSWAPTQAHNGYLETYLNLGWAGVALLVLVLAAGYRTVTVGLRGSASTSALMLAYFIVGIVYNFTEAAFFRITSPAWLALLLAMTRVPGAPGAKRQPSFGRGPTGRTRPVQLRGRDPVGENAVAFSRKS